MPKLNHYAQACAVKAKAERKQCEDWLTMLMKASPKRTRTKADLCAEAIARFRVSKNSFDYAWIAAIEKAENRSWYKSLQMVKRTKPPRLH
jgi:hypothetical protein